jgi:hypothetical protein
MHDQPTHCEFMGRLHAMTRRQTGNGKTVTTVVVASERGQYTDYCVADYWRAVPDGMAIGDDVALAVRMAGREWQGKWYAGLVADRLDVVRGAAPVAAVAEPPAAAADAPAADAGLPF